MNKISPSYHPLILDFINVILFTIISCLWIYKFISLKVGLVNLLPTFVFIAIWYFFIKIYFKKKHFRYYFALGFILTLRLPVTISLHLQILNWLIYVSVIIIVFSRIFNYFKSQKKLIILGITTFIIFFNSFTHLGLNSPYTYTFRLINNLESNYTAGEDNNTTWECPYEQSYFVVHCDARHFIASEKIFTESDYDPSFSVLLRRFFYGYLNSLIGTEGNRFIASFILNLTFWLFACTAIYRICDLTNLNSTIKNVSMFCCASSWGFVGFVAQPMSYLVAYAYASIIIWASIEIIFTNEAKNLYFFSLLIISGALIYEIYPLTLTYLTILFFFKKKKIALLILSTQILLLFLWRKVSLEIFLGTAGDLESSSSGVKNLSLNFEIWSNAIKQLDYKLISEMILKGIQSYFFGNLIIGALFGFIFILYLFTQAYNNQKLRILLISSFSLVIFTFLSMIFIVPQMSHWSPNTGIQPRIAFYCYPINTIALTTIIHSIFPKFLYVLPLLTFLVAHIDTTGIASISVLFDYGTWDLYWK